MKRWLPLLFLTLTIAAQQRQAFVDLNVLTMDSEKVLRHQTVLVQDSRIISVSPATASLDKDTQWIDGRGKYLIPGLADLHIHLQPSRADNELMLKLFVANGVTTVLNMYGTSADLALRDDVANRRELGPTIFSTGPFISNAPQLPPSPDEIEASVWRQKEAGYDLLKIHGDFTPEGYQRLFEAARKAHLRVAGHAPRNLGIQAVLNQRQDMVAHAEEYLYTYFAFGQRNPSSPPDAEAKIQWLARATTDAGTWVTPNLTAYKGFSRQMSDLNSVLARPEVALLPRTLTADWYPPANRWGRRTRNDDLARGLNQLLERTTKAFQDAGVPLLAGTDTPIPCIVPGFSLHDELEELVHAGLRPFDALRAATANAGRFLGSFLGRRDEFGLVRQGYRADLVMLDANPLEDIRNTKRIAGVMIRGRWIPSEELVRLLPARTGTTRR